jgi:hypothetical protein
MSRLVDTTICPDCRAALDPGATCTACGLQVRGPIALQLWHAMVTADRLVEQLRAASSAPAVAVRTAPATSVGLPRYPTRTEASPAGPRRLPAASVPAVLLSLGALCLLVAAVVFVAVTWSLLGLTGRTLVLLAITALLAGAAVVLTRRVLRGAAETFWLIVAGMLTVDLLGAQSAGLAGLDALSWRGTGALVGAALLMTGTGLGLWARHQVIGRLYGVQGVAAAGALVLCLAEVWSADDPAAATAVAIPLLAAYGTVLRRLVPVAAYAVGGLAGASWLLLLSVGWDRALETARTSEWWADGRGWPLLVAAAFMAVAVHAPAIPGRARSVAAGLALLPLVLLGNGPQPPGSPTRDLLLACATLAALAALTALAPLVWARGAAALSAAGVLGLGLVLAVAPWDVLDHLDADGSSDPSRRMQAVTDNAAAWTALVAALAVVLAAASLLRHVPVLVRATAMRSVSTLTPALVALGTLATVLELEPPLWAGVLAAALATAAAGTAAWWSRDSVVPGALGSAATAYLALVTTYAAAASDLLAALTASAAFVVLAGVAALREREGATTSAAVSAALAAVLGGWALVAWGQVMSADVDAGAIALAAYAGLVGVLAAPLTRQHVTRLALEASAVVLVLLSAGMGADEQVVAMVVTIAGTAVCAVAVTNRDRSFLGWLGAFVLAIATVIRVATEVRAPELYTLPAACLLVAVGAWRLREEPRASSFTVLGSGLTLALLPSLLLALDEPVSLRGALVGAGAVLVLAAGVHLRLAAPFVLGAGTTAVLALRHLQPVAEAVPRWVSLGGVGVALLVVGITWEARRRDLASAQQYLTALR